YLAAVAAVAVATMVTAAIPLLHDRLTFFAFWPVIFLTSWLWGVGPGIVSSALSAVSVLAEAKVRTLPGPVGRLPAVALTAYASTEDRVRLLSAGFQMHVAKPADPAEITAAVAAVVTAAPPADR
ncbi:MAG: hypothetical protein AB1689_02465, partial [Thermodesulfobacteriota bacterium]